ncbi:MAG: pseudoazurin [Pseudomonadota bacterium]
MNITRRQNLGLIGGALAASAAPTLVTSSDAVHDVEMLNHHPDNKRELMVFYPDIVMVQPGDVIRFLATDRNHNSQARDDMLPEGAEPWRSKIGKEFELTLQVEGAYGYFCTPHKSYGMVGLILVGDVSGNYEALKTVRQRSKSKGRFKDIFARADALLAKQA